MQAQTIDHRSTMKEQLQPKYANIWNGKTPSERKKLLQDAGYPASNHYSYRAWEFITSQMRIDVIAVIDHQERKQAAQAAQTQPTRSYWWQDNEDKNDE